MNFEKYGTAIVEWFNQISNLLAGRDSDLAQNFNPGPGYYGMPRDPKYIGQYKTSFADIYKIPPEFRDTYKQRIKGLKFSYDRTKSLNQTQSKEFDCYRLKLGQKKPGPTTYFKERP